MPRTYIKKTSKIYQKNKYIQWREGIILGVLNGLDFTEIIVNLGHPNLKYTTKRQTIKAFNTHFYSLLNQQGIKNSKFRIEQVSKDKNDYSVRITKIN